MGIMRPSAPNRSRWLVGTSAAICALLLTACGQGSGPATSASSAASSTTSSRAPSQSPTPSPTPSPTGSSGSPSESLAPLGPTLEVRVTGDDVAPVAQQIDLAAGETLRIAVRADRAGELHVHSDAERLLEFAGGEQGFTLTLDTPGSVDIEEHESGVLVARVLVR